MQTTQPPIPQQLGLWEDYLTQWQALREEHPLHTQQGKVFLPILQLQELLRLILQVLEFQGLFHPTLQLQGLLLPILQLQELLCLILQVLEFQGLFHLTLQFPGLLLPILQQAMLLPILPSQLTIQQLKPSKNLSAL